VGGAVGDSECNAIMTFAKTLFVTNRQECLFHRSRMRTELIVAQTRVSALFAKVLAIFFFRLYITSETLERSRCTAA
jgi:hypothetical protein